MPPHSIRLAALLLLFLLAAAGWRSWRLRQPVSTPQRVPAAAKKATHMPPESSITPSAPQEE